MNKEVTDPKSIHKLIDSLYRVTPVYLEVDGEDIPVKVLDSNPNAITIRTPKVNTNSRERVLTMRSKENIFVSTFLEVGTDDLGNSILQPLKILIKDIFTEDPKDIFTISNIINQNDIFRSIEDDRVTQIIKKAPNLNFMFDFFEVYINERMNSRMRLMNTHDKPIFVPNISEPNSVQPEFVPFADYLYLTKSSNFLDKFKSEICIPIKYKNFILIGYVHAMHSSRLDSNSFNTFKLVAASIIKDVHLSGVFEESRESCSVVEISSTSIKFLHPPTRLASRIFSMGGTIIFDLISKKGRRKFLRGVVKSIKPTQKDFAISCDLIFNNQEEAVSMEQFLTK
ncbi:MAG: hypothetical protein IPL26_12400 [Leptospiraceae bacterium]|nr:hypothetical protein [Leptospiraceae bacterium]